MRELFSYHLIVLTHGDDPRPLDQTLATFRDHMDVAPSSAYIHYDGGSALESAYAAAHRHDWSAWTVGGDMEAQGFCKAVGECWREAAAARHPYVFWLEHDFAFDRYLNLLAMSEILSDRPTLAQMSLMRDAVNANEKRAGGLFEMHRASFKRHVHVSANAMSLARAQKKLDAQREILANGIWHEHDLYFTTNPSLMRTKFMADNPWPGYDALCEGHFGIDLMRAGFRFGVWGDGTPDVRHISHRTGFGY